MPVAQRLYISLFVAIVLMAFFVRIWRVGDPPTYIFDEVYHVVTAKLIAHNDPRAFEWWNPAPEPNTAVDWLHPPLAKHTQALGMYIFGETSFGWRMSSVVFGTGVIALTMVLARTLFNSYAVALLAGVLASSDGLLLVMSRIAMNDIHVTFFILLSLLCYLRYRPELCTIPKKKEKGKTAPTTIWLLWTAVACGLAVASKWSGIFMLGYIVCAEVIFLLSRSIQSAPLKKKLQMAGSTTARLALLITTVASMYLASYTPMFLQGKDTAHFVELLKQTWSYQTNLTATHPYQSKPLEWFLNTKPVWLTVSYEPTTRADIYALGNPLLFWSADIALLLVLLWGIYTKGKAFTLPLVVMLSAYAIVWLPWVLSPRIMFFYHYTPAVPLLCIFLAWALHRLWQTTSHASGIHRDSVRISIITLVFVTMLVAGVWYPHWTNVQSPLWIKEQVFFALPSWK